MSFFGNFFQNFFGNNNNKNQRFDDHQLPKNEFRNPIWQNNDDDDEYGDDYRHFTNSNRDFTFQIFTDPFEMMQYFESQMDSMLKDMMNIRLDDSATIIRDFSNPNIPQILPPSNESKNTLRDQFLKPNGNSPLPLPSSEESNVKMDSDLDGKISPDEIAKIFTVKNPNFTEDKQLMESFDDSIGQNHKEFFGNSTFFNFTPKSNITMEQISTVTDSAGNTKTTVKRQTGDKMHTIITTRDKNGVKTIAENFRNLNESGLEPSLRIEDPKLGESFWHKFLKLDP